MNLVVSSFEGSAQSGRGSLWISMLSSSLCDTLPEKGEGQETDKPVDHFANQCDIIGFRVAIVLLSMRFDGQRSRQIKLCIYSLHFTKIHTVDPQQSCWKE